MLLKLVYICCIAGINLIKPKETRASKDSISEVESDFDNVYATYDIIIKITASMINLGY